MCLEMLSHLLSEDGVPVGVLAIGRDVTERNALQAQLAEARKLEALGTLAGGVAHDFNNIIAVILGNAELGLAEPGVTPSLRERLDAIVAASNRARGLVRQVMLYARAEREPRTTISLKQIVDDAIAQARADSPVGIDFRLSVEGEPVYVLASEPQLHQVVTNLCANAVYAIGGDEGAVGLRLRSLRLSADQPLSPELAPGLYAQLSVEDSGPGMDGATVERIFEPFFTTKPPGQGAGLGLSVVKGIVTSHGGTITVTSEPRAGARFDVYLPAAASPSAREERRGEVRPLGAFRAHVLFVDDEPALVKLAVRALERAGHRVSGYDEPVAAIAAFAADPFGYDVVFV